MGHGKDYAQACAFCANLEGRQRRPVAAKAKDKQHAAAMHRE
jgi:hypothetical protein